MLAFFRDIPRYSNDRNVMSATSQRDITPLEKRRVYEDELRQRQDQIAALNTCFRHRNADSTHTPSYFKSLAADCGIEFQLAISDPRRRSTSGIVRKYTPVTEWTSDDKMKSSASRSVIGDSSALS